MARFKMELPLEVMRDIQKISNNTEEIFGGMTRAGAEVVADTMRGVAPPVVAPHVKISRTYRTPSDDGINTKVYVSGYVPFSDPNREYFARRGRSSSMMYYTNKGVPIDFIAIMYEYGRSTAPFPKKPFMRKSFNKGKIEDAMRKAQRFLSGGTLDE